MRKQVEWVAGAMSEADRDAETRSFDDYAITLGDMLRGERATLGKSLLDVQDELRIKATYIEAIENGDSTVFETPGFIAGYVRSYARYLNIDPEACFIKFCEESGFDGVNAGLAPENERQAEAEKPARLAAAGFDPLASPRIPTRPRSPGFFANFSVSAVWSIFVLVGLIGGLGYGGWTVLQEVQRVQITPSNDTPVVVDQYVSPTDTLLASQTTTTGPDVTVAAGGPVLTLEELYRPSELAVPEITPRDGRIANLDPDTLGAYAVTPETASPTEPLEIVAKVVEEGPLPIDVVAVNPAWIRVFTDEGTILFEKILDKGERYRVPADVKAPLMRAGNSGSVYVLVGDEAFGPVGTKTGVARRVDLSLDGVTEAYQTVESLEVDYQSIQPVNVAETAPELTQPIVQE